MAHPIQNLSQRLGTPGQMIHPDANEARAQSLYESNTTQSLTKSLPPEVLAHIFHYSIQLGPPRTRPQFIIGAVCSLWRTILWNTRSLWVKYSQEVWSDTQRDTHILLQTYFDNSGIHPISIHIGFRYRVESSRDPAELKREKNRWYEEVALLKPTRTILFSPCNAKRIHTLRLDQLPPSWLLLARQHCTGLQTLEVKWMGIYPFGPISQEMKIFWDRMTEQLPWTSIIVLNIGEIPLDICYELLAGCPNLIDFSAKCCLPLERGHRNEKHNVMEHLQRLRLRALDTFHYSPFQFFQFPVLQHFSGSVPRSPKPPFDKLLWTIPLTITSLELRLGAEKRDGKVPNWLSVLFSRMPQLTQLSLTIFPAIPLSGIFPVLHESALLPSLRVFQCRYDSRAREEMTTLSFLQLMKQKKQTGFRGFRFDSVNARVNWPEDIREELRGLVGQGFDLEISEDGAMVPWLEVDRT